MPPEFNQVMQVSTTSINQVFAGQGGDGPLQPLYEVEAPASFALVFIAEITPEDVNQPAYILNVGTSAFYRGGDIHDLPGQPAVEPPHGQYQSSLNAGLLMMPGEQLTLQLANPGSFILSLQIFIFAPIP